jgi:hypothetical protein
MFHGFGKMGFLLAVCLLVCQPVADASIPADQKRSQNESLDDSVAGVNEPRKPHWSDLLKNIPVGPYRLDVGGSVRLRFENDDDFNIQRYADQRKSTLSQDGFLLHRSRLDFDLRLNTQAHFFAQFQDSRVYDSDFGKDDFALGCPYWNSFGLRQVFLEQRRIGGTPFGLKLGRQSIFYGDNRIWGPGEWGNVGRYTWDAVKLIAETKPAEVHFIYARRVNYDDNRFIDNHDANLDVLGAYAMLKNLPCKLDLFWLSKLTDPYIIVSKEGATADLHTHTVGFYADGKFAAGWDYGGTFAHTFGDRNDARVEAYGANARLGYTFEAPWQPRLGAEYSFASGDSDPDDGVYRTFDGAFGAVDKMYGRMNLFSWMNIQDFQLSYSIKPTAKTAASLDCHWFYIDEAKDAWYYCDGRSQRRDPTGQAGRAIGREIDLIISHKHSDHVEFQAGYAHFFPGGFLKKTGPSPDADWLFFQALYSF